MTASAAILNLTLACYCNETVIFTMWRTSALFKLNLNLLCE